MPAGQPIEPAQDRVPTKPLEKPLEKPSEAFEFDFSDENAAEVADLFEAIAKQIRTKKTLSIVLTDRNRS